MLSKCANPACSTSFRYMREGKLFEIDTRNETQFSVAGEKKPARRVEFFWLCGKCATNLTVIHDHTKGVITVPQTTPFLVRRAAAS
jgi:hypothetical protein